MGTILAGSVSGRRNCELGEAIMRATRRLAGWGIPLLFLGVLAARSPDAFRLNSHGKKRLQEMAAVLQECGVYPLVIEPTPDRPELDAARRDQVVQILTEKLFTVPEEWVVVADPAARGVSGDEAMRIYRDFSQPQALPAEVAYEQGTTPTTATGTGMSNAGAETGPQEAAFFSAVCIAFPAVLHDRKGDFEAFRNFCRAALAGQPNNAELYCDFGYSCYLQRGWQESEESLRRALALKPDLARAHDNPARSDCARAFRHFMRRRHSRPRLRWARATTRARCGSRAIRPAPFPRRGRSVRRPPHQLRPPGEPLDDLA